MHKMNIRNLDLNLLIALSALLEEKHVTHAAERINLSQPAMSRSLARLRDMFQDPLLVKGAGGMTLTARAEELYLPLQNIMREITDIIQPPSHDPSQMQGEIVIATRDNELATILPKAIQQINSEAPGLKLRIVSLQGDNLSSLEHHQVDFVLTGSESKSATLHRCLLYKERFVCLASSQHVDLTEKISLEKYVSMKHCLVTISGFGTSIVDDCLSQKGLKRDIVVRVPHFLAAAFIVADSDLITTLPEKVASLFSQNQRITLLEPPLKLPHFPIYLYWHTRNQHNPIHQWIKKVIKNISV